ncbi:MAG: DUF2520 domain-containing protein [Ignavibacteriae bacterium]|nr:DUF2520 domain-containing protein [Ignavibacteria bacterium]MBI3364338.1 DUF2520 domain-containing protein [Ignavibacteriota bacterium]
MARRPKVSIIGAGTVGSVIVLALHDKGYPIVSIINRSGQSAIALAKAVKCERVSTNLNDLAASTQILIIAVSDAAIAEIAVSLAQVKRVKFKGMFVFHLSGAHTSDLLEPVRKKGAVTASIHPIQTFPRGQRLTQLRARLRGISYGIEGNQEGIKLARQIVNDLEGRAVVIPKELKPLYHIACVFASNYMMVFINTISELSKRLGFGAAWTEILGPLMTTSMENVVTQPISSVLTGPIVRKDFETLERHLDALAESAPNLLPLYTVCGIELVRLAKSSGRLTENDFTEILSIFRKSLKQSPPSKTKKVNQ